jgi:arylsulfate sulfotransferase
LNVQINYYQPVIIVLYNGSLSTTRYTLVLQKNLLPDPGFTASFELDPNHLTPLAGILHVSPDQAATVSYMVKGQDGDDFMGSPVTSNNAGDLKINAYGLYPNTKNLVRVFVTNKEGTIATHDLFVATGELPKEFPDSSDIVVNKLDNKNVKTNFILYYPYKTIGAPFNSPGNMAYPVILDKHGKVRWYMSIPFVMDMKAMVNGHFLQYYYGFAFREVDLLGNTYKQILPPNICHHDFQLLPNGNIVYTGVDQSINHTDEDKIYELDYNTGAVVKMINLYDLLDPTRPQQPFISTAPNDWFHNNSLAYDSTDNSLIVTGRHQSTICKVDYATGKLKWIISDPSYWKAPLNNYLLQPSGSNFEYTWGQHSAVINPADHNKFIVFDNGNARSYTNPLIPENSYSRLVEFSVDAQNNNVTQTFDFGKTYGAENYSPALGSVDYVEQNLFVCFPLINKDANGNASDYTGTPSIRFMEVDRSRNVVLDISVKNRSANPQNGYRTYRGHPFKFN